MRRLKIPLYLLRYAATYNRRRKLLSSIAAYLDLETGDVIRPEIDGLDRAEVASSDRYAEIPRFRSYQDYKVMVNFIKTVEDQPIREALENAITGVNGIWGGPFRRFRETVAQYPDVAKRWSEYRAEDELQRLVQWLSTINVEPIFE